MKYLLFVLVLFCSLSCCENTYNAKKGDMQATTIGIKVNWELPVPDCSTCKVKSITQGTHKYLIYSMNNGVTMIHDPDCNHKN